MSHIFESATSGRAKCRGCGVAIARGELRFGERLPNPFAEGEITHWFHPTCAAFKRPDALLEAIGQQEIPGHAELEAIAKRAAAHTRLQRIDGAERSPSGQAKCRHCHEPIERGSWRIRLVFHEEGQFSPGGFIHLKCRGPYFETDDVRAAVMHFSVALGHEDKKALDAALAT